MNHIKALIRESLDTDAFQRLGNQLGHSGRLFAVTGAVGGARGLAIAQAILAENRPTAILTADPFAAQTLAQELQYLIDLLGAASGPVFHFPALEVDPYRGLSIHPETAAARAQALWQVLHQETPILVASVRAAAVRLQSPQRFLRYCITLKQRDEFVPERLCDHLRATGYIGDDPVTEPGEFSLRGGILDVFSPQESNPVRIEFFGDDVESLRSFDAESQRSQSTLDAAHIIPMRELHVEPSTLERWAEQAPRLWGPAFQTHLEEELAMARQGEFFSSYEFMIPAVDPLTHTLFDYLQGFRLIVCDHEAMETSLDKHNVALYDKYVDRIEAAKPSIEPEQIYMKTDEWLQALERFPRLQMEQLWTGGTDERNIEIPSQSPRKYHGHIRELISDTKKSLESGEDILLLFSNLGRAERVSEILSDHNIPVHLCAPGENDKCSGPQESMKYRILAGVGALHSGFYLPGSRLRVLTGFDIFDESEVRLSTKRAQKTRRGLFLSDFRDLKLGDYVVHVEHGIGQFQGLKTLQLDDARKEFVLLTYHDDAKLYVPVERLDLIQKYSSFGSTQPGLDRLGSATWNRTKSRIKRSMRDMAGQLLKLYAERRTVQGYPYSVDSPWQKEFEDMFEFELTPDQLDAVSSVKHDMEAARPMDRLLCGDVGYGKTEVAMRAAFKAIMDGKQVAILTPTTVLAFQHFRTFSQRFGSFPIQIELLSRFRNPRQQRQTILDLEAGKVDIVIGTHRLLSKDVKFRELGLVVVDEEQRFGVTHKERLKTLKTQVDVLTLTATPIPRTLHMALLGLRDMSTIETPPKNRLAIQTSVLKFSPEVIRSAIDLELAREGQVYFVHNRVETIFSMATAVQRLAPKARIGVAHGQMSERELEKVMLAFFQHELDVLVTTTIIENGLDIPRVNTIVIDRAERYGLSQLYQLRGRVGRSDRRAYAYLLIPTDEGLTGDARKRLSAIREFSDLGTGFRVAALDLEIRGAGNLLGGEQHGHVEAVGFDLYCSLLEQTVQELQGESPVDEIATSLNLNLDIRIPESYIADSSQRLRMYKRISSATQEELDALRQELVDRFGSYPAPVENLFRYARLRQEAMALKIHAIERNRDQIHFRFLDQSNVAPAKLLDLVASNSGTSFSPQGVLSLETATTAPDTLFKSIHEVLDHIRS